MLRSRALFDNAADARFFVAPAAWPALLRAVDRGLNVALVGTRGSGKTTTLRRLQLQLRDSGEHVVYVDATASDAPDELTRRVRDRLSGKPSALAEGLNATQESLRSEAAPIAGASRQMQADLRAIDAAPRAIVIVDGSSSGPALHGVFGRLRDVLWQTPHQWIVAVDADDRAQVLRPPADAFFDIVLDLGPMVAEQLTRVLMKRASGLDLAALEHIAQHAEGNPRRALHAVIDAVVHDVDPTDALARQAALQSAATGIGRPHAMLMAELMQRGQGSASDPSLQRSLGVTRGRLSQLLSDLEERDLVSKETAASAGPGRPRTVYRPTSP